MSLRSARTERQTAQQSGRISMPLPSASFSFVNSSTFLEFLVNGSQPATQMEDRIAFARQQGVHANARLFRQFLEAVAQPLVPDKRLALLVGQLEQGLVNFLQQQAADIGGLRPAFRRGK